MQIGVGLDPSLQLDFAAQATIAKEIAALGYSSIWTPDHTGEDAFLTCAWRWAATAEVVSGGLMTGIGVSSVGPRTPLTFAQLAGTVSKLSGGKFILGMGTGGAYRPEYRREYGMNQSSMLTLMRDYISAVRTLINGELLEVESRSFQLRKARLAIKPPAGTPIYLGALGPEMLRLAGELADGVILNWCTAEQVAWSRQRIAEGAARAGRDPSTIRVTEFIRICIDDDAAVARRTYATALKGYAMGRGPDAKGRPQGYRAHFERAGFAAPLAAIDKMIERGATSDEVTDAFPEEFLTAVGYYGLAAGASKALKGLSEGLDSAIIRVVAPRPGIDSVRATITALSPQSSATRS